MHIKKHFIDGVHSPGCNKCLSKIQRDIKVFILQMPWSLKLCIAYIWTMVLQNELEIATAVKHSGWTLGNRTSGQ